jgi:hypothetical protein
MSIKATVIIESDSPGHSWVFTNIAHISGDNPLFNATCAEQAVVKAARPSLAAIARVEGDIRDNPKASLSEVDKARPITGDA